MMRKSEKRDRGIAKAKADAEASRLEGLKAQKLDHERRARRKAEIAAAAERENARLEKILQDEQEKQSPEDKVTQIFVDGIAGKLYA